MKMNIEVTPTDALTPREQQLLGFMVGMFQDILLKLDALSMRKPADMGKPLDEAARPDLGVRMELLAYVTDHLQEAFPGVRFDLRTGQTGAKLS